MVVPSGLQIAEGQKDSVGEGADGEAGEVTEAEEETVEEDAKTITVFFSCLGLYRPLPWKLICFRRIHNGMPFLALLRL